MPVQANQIGRRAARLVPCRRGDGVPPSIFVTSQDAVDEDVVLELRSAEWGDFVDNSPTSFRVELVVPKVIPPHEWTLGLVALPDSPGS